MVVLCNTTLIMVIKNTELNMFDMAIITWSISERDKYTVSYHKAI